MPRKHKPLHRKQITVVLCLLVVFVFSLLGIVIVKANLIQIKRDFVNEIAHLREKFLSYPDLVGHETQGGQYSKTIPVLLYHGIVKELKSADEFATTQESFREQMTTLYNSGYRTITAAQFADFMNGKITLPAKSFLLTFDDGRRDSYYGADPILDRLGYTAVMFAASGQSANSDRLFSSYYLNPLEIAQMASNGRWEIQSHGVQGDGGFIETDAQQTRDYLLSNKKWLQDKNRLENDTEYSARVSHELEESKVELEHISKKPVSMFSYPFSDYGQQSHNNANKAESVIHDALKKAYTYAFQQQWSYEDGFVGNYPTDDKYHMRRIEPGADWTGTSLVSFLNSGQDVQPSSKSSRINFKNDLSRWKSSWGTKEVVDGNLMLKTTGGRVSSFTLLDGSRAWKDYKFSVRTNLHDTGAFAVYANLERPGTGVRCSWKGGSVSLEKMKEGKIIKRSLFSSAITSGDHMFSVVSTGQYVGCLEDNNIVGALQEERNSLGGVGVEFWATEGGAYAELLDAEVDFDLGDIDLSVLKIKSQAQTRSLVQPVTVKALTASLRNFTPASPRYAVSVADQTVLAFEDDRWGLNNASSSHDMNTDAYSLLLSHYTTGGGSLSSTDITPVGKEYAIKGRYTSSLTTELLLEYNDSLGHKKWLFITDLLKSSQLKDFEYIVQLPEDIMSFKVVYQIKGNGHITIDKTFANPLRDGSFDKPYVTLTFDDGYSSFLTKAYPILKKYGMKATLPVITGATDLRGYMTPDELAAMKNVGNEISSHTRHHIKMGASVSTATKVAEIVGAGYDLKKSLLGGTTFVYPYGNVSEDLIKLVQRAGYIGARSTLRGYNTKNTDIFLLKDQIISDATRMSDVDGYIRQIVANKQWLILEFHRVTDVHNPADEESISVARLDALLKKFKDAGIESVTLEQGLRKMK